MSEKPKFNTDHIPGYGKLPADDTNDPNYQKVKERNLPGEYSEEEKRRGYTKE